MPALTPEYQLGTQEFTLNFFREIFSRVNTPALLVFDNFQDAGAQASYTNCVEILNAAIGVPPSSATTALIKS